MKVSTTHTEGGPMIGVGSNWMNTTAAQKLAGDIYRAVIDAHRTEAYRHAATPSYLEYPSFDESANFDPVPRCRDLPPRPGRGGIDEVSMPAYAESGGDHE